MITPTQDELDARTRAAAAGRRIEAAREQGGDAAADAERDAIRAEMGLPPISEAVTTAQATTEAPLADHHRLGVDREDLRAADDGVEVVGLTMGGEPLPTEGVTQPEAVTIHQQPTKVTGATDGYVTREKDGPPTGTKGFWISAAEAVDADKVVAFAKACGAYAAGPRASEDLLRPGQVRALWFCGAFRPFSADWSGSAAFTQASHFADALRNAGLNDVAVTTRTDTKAEKTGLEGVQAAEEAPAGMQTPEALAKACGAVSVGYRFEMDPADEGSAIYVDWRSDVNGMAMRAFFDEVPHALGFCRALMQRGDVEEAKACIPAETTEERRAAAQGFAADPMLGKSAADHLRAAIRVMENRRKARARVRAVGDFIGYALGMFGKGVLLGLGFLAGWAIVGVILGLLR